MFVCLQVGSVRGRGSSGPAGSGSGGSRTISGPVQPVALFHHEDPQLEQPPDIANVEDAEAEAEAPVEVVDPKVAEMAAAMERVTVEEPANVNKGSAGKTIKVTSNYIRLVDLFPPCSPSS